MRTKPLPPHQVGGLQLLSGAAVTAVRVPVDGKRTAQIVRGFILYTSAFYARILTEDGRLVRFKKTEVLPRGYCERCQVAADVAADGGLICPQCGTSECRDVPAELRPQWARDVDTTHAELAWLMRDGRTTYDQARRFRRERHEARQARVQAQERREWIDALRSLGQAWDADMRAIERGELLEEEELPAPRAVFIPLPELPIERVAEDSEPDGADELTNWLERQFRRAA